MCKDKNVNAVLLIPAKTDVTFLSRGVERKVTGNKQFSKGLDKGD